MDSIANYYSNGVYKIMHLVRLDHKKKPMRHFLSIGGKKDGCVTIEVDEKETGYHENYKTAHINSIEYNKRCNKNGDLLQGEGTRNMIRFALAATKRLCPWVEEYSLRDASARTCALGGPEINLSDMYIALYNQTWYEKHFDARIHDSAAHEKYRKMLKKLSSKKFKEASPYERFRRALGIRFDKDVITLYEDSKTFREFFDRLNAIKSKEEVCIVLQPWITKFIRDLVLEREIMIEGRWDIAAVETDVSFEDIDEKEYKGFGGGSKLYRFDPPIKSYVL